MIMITTYLIIVGILILLTVFDPLEDAYNIDKATKRKGHRMGRWFVFTALLLPTFYQPQAMDWYDKVGAFLLILGGYTGFRFALFNPIFNKARHLKPNYLGDDIVDTYEKMLMPIWSFYITRIVSFGMGLLFIWNVVKIYIV